LVRSADVIVHDRLVSLRLLDEAQPTAERIFAGKKPGEVHSRQLVIDALLISKAKEGKSVVRLKGGDPFVFGRGAEEAMLLVDADVPFEIVPGVTSAIAAPAYAGIPLTHRGISGSFTVVTAREDPDGGAPQRWHELAVGADTLVLMMAVSSLADTVAMLITNGRPGDQPAAVVEWGTTGRQRTIVGPLASIAELASDAHVKAPATTIVGDVVAIRDTIGWFEHRPLHGLRVVVTRARAQAWALGDKLDDLGAEVLYVPTIDITPPGSFEALDLGIRSLQPDGEGWDWIIFTSANAIDPFFIRLELAGLDARALAATRVAAVGSSTATQLETHGVVPDLVPGTFTGEALVAALGPGPGRVLFPRAEDAPPETVAALELAGWAPFAAPAYKNVPADLRDGAAERVRSGDFDVVVFTSGTTVRNFVEAVARPPDLGLGPEGDGSKLVACIGPVTSEAAAHAGMRVDIVPDEHTIDGLVAAIAAARRDGTIGR
jgi:uroporphyrinogen III methyltransferase/synthase